MTTIDLLSETVEKVVAAVAKAEPDGITQFSLIDQLALPRGPRTVLQATDAIHAAHQAGRIARVWPPPTKSWRWRLPPA